MPLFWLSLAFICGILAGWRLGGSITRTAPLPSGFIALALIATVGLCFVYLLAHLKNPRLRRLGGGTVFGWLSRHWPPDHEELLPGFILPCLPIVMLLGAFRYQATLPQLTPGDLSWYNESDPRYILEGIVEADPDLRDTYTLLRVSVDQLNAGPDFLGFFPVKGDLQARLPPGGDWRYGDRVKLAGRLRTPFETDEFSYQTYLSHHGIYTTLSCWMQDTSSYCPTCKESQPDECAWLIKHAQATSVKGAIYSLRRKALRTIEAMFPEPESGLLAGILLGIETNIPDDVMKAFRQTGTTHIIAISGYNFTIISAIFIAVFGRLLGRWRSLPAAWLGIAFYAVLAGASAGVVRAAIMGSFSIFALRIGRRSSGLNTLAFVAVVMALFDPHVLWDISFQLSFMATLGLILYADPLKKGFISLASSRFSQETVNNLAGPVSEYLLFTLAAQLTTLPLIIYYFRQTSLVSLLANPLILPAQPPLMLLGGLATLLGMVSQMLGQVSAVFAWPWLAYTIRVVELLAQVRNATFVTGPTSLWVVVGFYLLLFACTLWHSQLKSLIGRISGPHIYRLGWWLNLGLALLVAVAWQQVFALPDGRLHLTVFDVGSGDALLIQTPTGRNVLIDGGLSPNALADAIGRRLPFGNRVMDYLVVAAVGEQQVAALPHGLDRFQVKNVLWAGPQAGNYSSRELQKRLAEEQIPMISAQKGHVLELGNGARLEVLNVSRHGAILLLEWQSFRLLMPVGLDFESMQELLHDSTHSLGVTALLLAEGGYAPLNPPEWLAHWNPQVVLLSVAAGDQEGLPHPETLAALQDLPVLRTDHNGWIHLSTDGIQFSIDTETSFGVERP